jgi:hypothetical protein
MKSLYSMTKKEKKATKARLERAGTYKPYRSGNGKPKKVEDLIFSVAEDYFRRIPNDLL